MTSIAGTGTAFSGGDLGPSVSASVNYPSGIWGDSNGNIYISEWNGYRVRKTDSAGIISTLIGSGGSVDVIGTGGLARSTSLGGLWGLSGDSIGKSLYITNVDYFVWKYNFSSGMMTRFAGSSPGSTAYSGDGGNISKFKPTSRVIFIYFRYIIRL